MRLIKFYQPFVGKLTEFEDKFQNNSVEYASAYWNKLDEFSIVFVLILAVISIGSCIFYFTAYNEMPGRHYQKKHWLMFFLVQAVMGCGFLTYISGYLFAKPVLEGTGMLLFNIALGNLIYSLFIFAVVSVIWWLFLPTNAYRWIGK